MSIYKGFLKDSFFENNVHFLATVYATFNNNFQISVKI